MNNKVTLHLYDYQELEKNSHYEGKTDYLDINDEKSIREVLEKITLLYGKKDWEARIERKLVAVCENGKIYSQLDNDAQISTMNIKSISVNNYISYTVNKEIDTFLNQLFPTNSTKQMPIEKMQEAIEKKNEIIKTAYKAELNGKKIDLENEICKYKYEWIDYAVSIGDKDAMLGMALSNLKNGNTTQGIEQLSELSESYEPAKRILGILYYTGNYDVVQDKEKGLNLMVDYYNNTNVRNNLFILGKNVYLGGISIEEIRCQYIKLSPIEIQFEKDEEKGIEVINVEAEKDNNAKFAMGKMYFEGKFKSGENFVLDKEKGMQMMVEAEKDNPYFNLGLGTAFLFGNTKKIDRVNTPSEYFFKSEIDEELGMKLIERACSLNTEVKYWVALYFLKEKIYNKEKAIPLMEDAMILNDKLKRDYAIRLYSGIPSEIEINQERAKQLICEVDNGKIETSFAENYLKIEAEKLKKK